MVNSNWRERKVDNAKKGRKQIAGRVSKENRKGNKMNGGAKNRHKISPPPPYMESKRDRKMSKEKMKHLAFDLSFTSQDFKNMDLTKVSGKKSSRESEVKNVDPEVPVPKLRFNKIRSLKLCLLSFASKEGGVSNDTIKELFTTKEFANCVFDLIDLNGDGMVDIWELKAITISESDQKMQAFKLKLDELIEGFSNGFDIVTQEMFMKIWQGKGLDDVAIETIREVRGDKIDFDSVMEFIILITNPK